MLTLTGGNGVAVGLSVAQCGFESDTGLALQVGLEQHLQNAGMVVLCDKLFGHSTHIKPLPKDNQHYQGCNANKFLGTERMSFESFFVAQQ
jgi:hypothetical protein